MRQRKSGIMSSLSDKNQSPEKYIYDGATYDDIRNRKKIEHRVAQRFVKTLGVFGVCIPFYYLWLEYYSQKMYIKYYGWGNVLMLSLYTFMFFLIARIYGGFSIHIKRISEIIYSQIVSAVVANVIIYVVMWLLLFHVPNIPRMLALQLLQCVIITAWAYYSHRWYFSVYPTRPTAIIYDELENLDKLISQYGLQVHFSVRKKIHVDMIADPDGPESTKDEIMFRLDDLIGTDCDIVFLCGLHSHVRNQIVKYCVSKDIVCYTLPRLGDVLMASGTKMPLFHLPMVCVQRYNPTPEYLFAKRLADIVLSLTALVILSPLMLVVAICIHADGGPVFYRQTRLTQDGRLFEMLKFRSMRPNAEADGVARLSTGEDDPRITRVGRFIRSCRIDELPQLINILKGEMSIVGPRPERPEIAAQYKETVPEFDLRLQCKSGLTGYAQVYGQYNTTPYDKLMMDLMYISKPSLAEDLKIILATVLILFRKDSTEGIPEGSMTAVRTPGDAAVSEDTEKSEDPANSDSMEL